MHTERSYNLFEKYVFIPVHLIYTPTASYKYGTKARAIKT